MAERERDKARESKMSEIEKAEREFPYNFFTPNKILMAVYERGIYPRAALCALETRARAYRGLVNSGKCFYDEVSEKIGEVERVIEELKAAFSRPPAQSNQQPKVEPAPEAQPPAQGAAAVPELTDTECLKKLIDTGFIAQNTNIKTKIVYAKTRAVTAPKIYRELLKMLNNDGDRAARIMRNNISGVETGLKQYLSRISKGNKK
jgi:hypothetical protein